MADDTSTETTPVTAHLFGGEDTGIGAFPPDITPESDEPDVEEAPDGNRGEESEVEDVEGGAQEDVPSEDTAEDRPAAAEEPPSWFRTYAEQSAQVQAGLAQAIDALVKRVSPEPQVADEPEPEPWTVDAILTKGLEALGIDPRSDEARNLREAAALQTTREFFPEDQHPQIERRVNRANQTVRQHSESAKLNARIQELEKRLNDQDAKSTRAPIFSKAAKQLTGSDDYRGEFPLASRLSADAVEKWLSEEVGGDVTATSVREALYVLDGLLDELNLEDVSAADTLYRAAALQNDPRRYVVKAYADVLRQDGQSQNVAGDTPRGSLERPRKRPSPSKGTEGGRVSRTRREADTNPIKGWLFGDNNFNLDAEADALRARARNRRVPGGTGQQLTGEPSEDSDLPN